MPTALHRARTCTSQNASKQERRGESRVGFWARRFGQRLYKISKACLLRSQALVTTDSGPRHIAAALQVPTVLLAGPVDPRLTCNYNPWEIAVHTSLPCQPCWRHECALGHVRCMRELDPQWVYRAVLQLLSETSRRVA